VAVACVASKPGAGLKLAGAAAADRSVAEQCVDFGKPQTQAPNVAAAMSRRYSLHTSPPGAGGGGGGAAGATGPFLGGLEGAGLDGAIGLGTAAASWLGAAAPLAERAERAAACCELRRDLMPNACARGEAARCEAPRRGDGRGSRGEGEAA